MRRCRAPLAVLTLVLLSMLSMLAVGPARAGGPTSVLLVDPATGDSTSLYYSDDDYQALAGLVGVSAVPGSVASGSADGSGSAHGTGSGITVTWLIHDVSVWRVDRIHLDAKGGPWIATQEVSGDASLWDGPVVWHTSANGKELSALLGRLALGTGSVSGDGSPVTTDVAGNENVAAPETPGSAAAADAPIEEGRSSTDALAWGLLGLALGVVGTVVGLRLVPGTRGRPGRTTTAVDPLSLADEPGWASADQMSWPAGR